MKVRSTGFQNGGASICRVNKNDNVTTGRVTTEHTLRGSPPIVLKGTRSHDIAFVFDAINSVVVYNVSGVRLSGKNYCTRFDSTSDSVPILLAENSTGLDETPSEPSTTEEDK
jgi:hypothetical protein